jgi:hypothetical protein
MRRTLFLDSAEQQGFIVWSCLCLRGFSFEAWAIVQHFSLFLLLIRMGRDESVNRVFYYNTPFVEDWLVISGQVKSAQNDVDSVYF